MSASPLAGPIVQLADRVLRGEVTPVELITAAEQANAAADAGPEPVNAFLSANWERARDQALALADRRSQGAAFGSLAGLPIAVQDNLSTTDFPTTCGSRLLAGYTAPFDATVVRRLREAGAIIVGKTNLDEFGMGSSTESSAYGPTRNPLDHTRVPGGSSGGSAAAVAAGVVPAALGSCTGGSVRQPAAFCGVVGIEPTYGAVSRYGLFASASSLDQVGTFGRTVYDAALLLQAVAGHDPWDSTSAERPPFDFAVDLEKGVEGLTIGVPEEYFSAELDAGIAEVCRVTLRRLENLGARIREVSLPYTRHAIPAYYIIASAEASSNLARFDGIRFGVGGGAAADNAGSRDELLERTRALFGPEAKRRILLGTYLLSSGQRDACYGKAQRVRRRIAKEFRQLWADGVDAVFTPTTPSAAFRVGEKTADPYAMYLSDAFTVTANLAGIPALSLPVGRLGHLPLGGQLMGAPWSEATLVRIAHALEFSMCGEPLSVRV